MTKPLRSHTKKTKSLTPDSSGKSSTADFSVVVKPEFDGFSLSELWQVMRCHQILEERSCTLKGLADSIGVPSRELGKLLKRFDKHLTPSSHGKLNLFDIGHGRGPTHLNRDAEAMKRGRNVVAKIGRIVEIAKELFGTVPGNRYRPLVRIAAGISAFMSFVPDVIKKYTENQKRTLENQAVTYQLHSVHSHSLKDLNPDDFDILITEVGSNTAREASHDKDNMVELVGIPLRLLVPAESSLAKAHSVTAKEAVDTLVFEGLPLVILEETRWPRPYYPPLQILNPLLRYEYVSAHSIAHVMCAAGSAACLSTPLLLTDQQRTAVRAINLDFSPVDREQLRVATQQDYGSLGSIIFSVTCPKLSKRLEEERTLIGRLQKQFVARMREHAVNPYDGIESLQKGTMYFTAYIAGKMKWSRVGIRWYRPMDHIVRGQFSYRKIRRTNQAGGDSDEIDRTYHVEGDIAEVSGHDKQVYKHLVIKAASQDDLNEEFVASFKGSKAAFDGDDPLVGFWLGRRLPIFKSDPFRHSLGYAIIAPRTWADQKVTWEQLNNWVRPVQNEMDEEIEGLKTLPSSIFSATGE